jgi:hypothetical protein
VSLVLDFLAVWSIEVFRSGLGVVAFVNKKRLAGYLLGGVLVAVMLLGASYLAVLISIEHHYNNARELDEENPLQCMAVVNSTCTIETVSVNLSEIGPCGGNVSYKDIKNLDSVEDVNGSTGVVTCDRPQFR